jgi:hypothetical protein
MTCSCLLILPCERVILVDGLRLFCCYSIVSVYCRISAPSPPRPPQSLHELPGAWMNPEAHVQMLLDAPLMLEMSLERWNVYGDWIICPVKPMRVGKQCQGSGNSGQNPLFQALSTLALLYFVEYSDMEDEIRNVWASTHTNFYESKD